MNLLTSLRLFLWMTCLTGIVYPGLILLVGILSFPEKRKGDLVYHLNKPVGAKLIAQKFTSERYFFGRPSSSDYDALNSGGTNLGPTSLELEKQVELRLENLSKLLKVPKNEVPSDLLFASGSGLDPHISKAAAKLQIDRIVLARKLNPEQGKKAILELIDRITLQSDLWFSGKPRVNVLHLNISLDEEL